MGRFKCRLASNLITLDACRRRFKICPISPSSHVGEKEKEKVTSVVRWPEAYVFYLYYFPPPDWQKGRNQWGKWNQSWGSKSTRSMSQPSHCTQRTLMYLFFFFTLKTKKKQLLVNEEMTVCVWCQPPPPLFHFESLCKSRRQSAQGPFLVQMQRGW